MSAATIHRLTALAAVAGPVVCIAAVVGLWIAPAATAGELAVAAAVAGSVAVALVVSVPLTAIADRRHEQLRPQRAGGAHRDAATDVAIGLGDPAPLLVVDDPDEEVVALRTTPREVVIVTAGAFELLTRREIVALAQARLAAVRDPWTRLATHGAIAWWALPFVLPSVAVVAALTGAVGATGAAVAGTAIALVAPRWPDVMRDRCADAVASWRTSDPGGLAGAIRRRSGLGRRHDDLPADPTRVERRSRLALPALDGGVMTTNVGTDRRRRQYAMQQAERLEAADRAIGMHLHVDESLVSGRDLRRRWSHLARPVEPV